MLKLRASYDEEELDKQSGMIRRRLLASDAYRRCETLFCYVSFRNEVDTHCIIEQALADGKKVAVPRVEGSDMHFYSIASLAELRKSSYGILEPGEGARRAVPENGDLMLVPAAAFDTCGYRIGYGGGYYDKYLDGYPDLHTIGLAYDFQMLDRLPIDDYDRSVTEVICP